MASSLPWLSFDTRYPTSRESEKKFSAGPPTLWRTIGCRLVALHAIPPAVLPSSALRLCCPTRRWAPGKLAPSGVSESSRPSREALQNLLHYANAFIHTRPASNPLRGASIPGYTPGQMFTTSFVTADPTPGALALPPAAPNVTIRTFPAIGPDPRCP
jgi:hypothetical protein